MPQFSVLICEGSYIVRKGLVKLLKETNKTLTVREAADVESFMSVLGYYEPDIIIINPDLFGSGNKLIRELPEKFRGRAIALSSEEKRENISLFPQTLLYSDSKSTILEKVRKVYGTVKGCRGANKMRGTVITEREKLIVRYIALGLTNREIAEKLFISTHTVVTHRKNITRKLGIKTVSGLTVYAILNNLINIEDINK